MRPESGFWTAPNWPKIGKITFCMTSSSNFLDVLSLLLTILVNGPSFMSICFMLCHWFWSYDNVLLQGIDHEYWPRISRNWGELGIPNFARMSLMKCYWMLQNARVTAFIVSELLRENQQASVKLLPPPRPINLFRTSVRII